MTSQEEKRRKDKQRRDRRVRHRLVVAALLGIEPRPSVTVVAVSALLAALPSPGKPK
jgi:hypothetical protein